MAESDKIVIDPEHLAGGDGTVSVAMQLWSGRNGPVKFNQWQSLYFRLIREGYTDEAEIKKGESLIKTQARIRQLYEEVQTELHGGDHKALALIKSMQETPMEQLARTAQGSGRPGMTGDAGHTRSGVRITSGPDEDALEESRWSIATPRQGPALEPSAASPDVLFYRKDAQRVWEEDDATHTECTEELDGRLAELAIKLDLLEGATTNGIEFILRVEQMLGQYKEEYGIWLPKQGPDAGSLRTFAMERLVEINADEFAEEEDFKQHVYALGKLSGRSVQQGRMLCKSLWESSQHNTPQSTDRRDAAVPGLGGERIPGPPTMSSPEIERQGSPGGAPSSVDVVRAMTDMSQQFKESLVSVVDKFTAIRDGEDKDKGGGVYRSDKLQAISGLDFKRPLPHIRDDDPDLDRYDLEFDCAIECYSYGGRPLRDIDKLWMYSHGFKEGGTRMKVYNNETRRANRLKRLPEEAAAVLKELRIELRTYIYETIMQKRIRLDKQFAKMEQGGLTHADFRAAFDTLLQDMEESGMDMPTVETLYRHYLTKLNTELRIKVMSKEWKIDGPDKPTRNQATYKEVAMACSLCLEERADIYAAGHAGSDSFMAIDAGGASIPRLSAGGGGKGSGGAQPGIVCEYCLSESSHYSSVCPQRAADTRFGASGGSDGDFWRKKFQEGGAVCAMCKQPGHAQKHHLMAAQDYAKQNGDKGKGGGKDKKKGPPTTPATPKAKAEPAAGKYGAACPGGPTCKYFVQHGECKNYHSAAELKDLRSRYKAKQMANAATAGGRGGGGKAGGKGRGKDHSKSGNKGEGGKGGGTKGYVPREGDWTCKNCGTVGQYASRDTCYKCNVPRNETLKVVDAPISAKAKAKALAKAKTGLAAGGADNNWMISEEVRSMSDQFSHHGSKVARVPGTMEIGDYFGFTETDAECCYQVEAACRLEAEELQKSDTSFAELADKMMLLNPEFSSITRLADLIADEGEKDQNFLDRLHQRPVGYSAMTRFHMGRLCVPILNDTGATCSCMTEEQVVLILNHTQRMLAEEKITKTDYNYPIVQLYRYKNPAVLRGAEKTGVMPVEFAIVLRCEFIPDGCTRGPTKDIYFKIFKAGTCAVVGGVLGYPSLDHPTVPGGEGLGWVNRTDGHHYTALGVTIPRLDDQRKAAYHSAVTRYAESHGQMMCVDEVTGDSVNFIGVDAARQFRAAALAADEIPEGMMEPIGLDSVLLE